MEMRDQVKPGVTKIEVSKVEPLEIFKEEKGAIGIKSAFKLTATEIKANHTTGLAMASDTFPGTAVCSLVPGFCPGMR
ncbi:hypothetical protein COLO4_17564 [Corchorus olitorius]|uniref:Uncharacterized protein n=1 Tax=Corchorus olitorius TaxID=93759 RepID=A0A1R3JCC3_9ROSI|nr:hypothetical protein COLO4_17564 [Corchorus olitorius]